MYRSRVWLNLLAITGLLTAGNLHAQEVDAYIKSGTDRPCVLKDDIEGRAKEVGRLDPGSPVTVYLQISSGKHYFVKRKGSGPGEGSGWVPKEQVRLARPNSDASEVAEQPQAPSNPYHAILAEMASAPASALKKIAAGKKSEIQEQTAQTSGSTAAQGTVAGSGESHSSSQDSNAGWDIPKDHWARAAIEDLSNMGLIRVPDGKFEGDKKVNRFEMALLAQRLAVRSNESCKQLADQLEKVAATGEETREQVHKLTNRIADVESKMTKLASNKQSSPKPNDFAIKDLGHDVTSLRQTFTRSIAELALDRSKIEEYKASWNNMLTRIEKIEKKIEAIGEAKGA